MTGRGLSSSRGVGSWVEIGSTGLGTIDPCPCSSSLQLKNLSHLEEDLAQQLIPAVESQRNT